MVALLVAGGMWGLARLAPVLDLPAAPRIPAALALALTGLGVTVGGVISFRRAQTTVNPIHPEKTSALVRSGVYAVTRNPMYLGSVLILVAWAVFLSSALALLGPIAFVFYMNRFQIRPEERILASLFGASYAEYCSRVRRWI